MDKQNVMFPYNEILLGRKKGYTEICYNVDELWKCNASERSSI